MDLNDKLQNPSAVSDFPCEGNLKPHFFFDIPKHTLIGLDGETIRLRSQSLQVFVLLLKNANEIVSKEKILACVWKGLAVTDDSVTQCIVDIRRALGTEYRDLLQTVPRVGYRLCLGTDQLGHPIIAPFGFQNSTKYDAPLTEESAESVDNSDTITTQPAVTKRSSSSLVVGLIFVLLVTLLFAGLWRFGRNSAHDLVPPQGPTLAVLPFENVGTSPDDRYFSNGITEDIIDHLSRFSELGMVSWSAVSNRSSDNQSQQAVAKEFGVRYLISGSVRRDNRSVRVAVRLTDARNGRLLWSERYDEPLEDVFYVQDHISSQIVTTLAVKLTDIETNFSRTIPTKNIKAYQLSLLGRSELLKRTREGNLAARAHFAEAIELDVSYADAYIRLGETYLEEAVMGWTEWPAQSTNKALELAQTAFELSGATARSLGFLAHVHVRTGEHLKAQTYLDRAFLFNPNDPALHNIQGVLYLWNGNADKAINHLQFVLRYDPNATSSSSHLCIAYYVAGRPEDAVTTIERMIETAPSTLFTHIILTAALVELGDIESAKKAAKVVRQRHPFLTAEGASKSELFTNDEIRQRFVTSLRSAGIE